MTLQQDISGYIGRLFRETFGRGPKSVLVTFGQSLVAIYLNGFLSPLERILLDERQEETIWSTRDTLMQRLIPEIKANLASLTNQSIEKIYYDWNLNNKSGILIATAVQERAFGECEDLFHTHPTFKENILRLSKSTQKVPDWAAAYRLSPELVVLHREGVIAPIERELIQLGRAATVHLKAAKRHLEKRYLQSNVLIETLLNKSVQDIFVDWDFDNDQNWTVFKLKS